jgi:hypothetical protein
LPFYAASLPPNHVFIGGQILIQIFRSLSNSKIAYMKTYQLIPLTILILGSLMALPFGHPGVEGRWSAIDEFGNNILIEFTPTQEYNLFVNGENLTADVSDFGQIRYEVHRRKEWLKIELYGANGKQEFAQLAAETQNNQLQLVALTPHGRQQQDGHILLQRVP